MDDFSHRLAGPDGAVLIVALPPSVNHITAESIRQGVSRLVPNRDDAAVILDCAGVSLITSIGITALLQIQERCRDAGAPMALASLTEPIRRMLVMLKLDRQFEMAHSVDDALTKFEARR